MHTPYRRIIVLIAIVFSLYPILVGGIAGRERQQQAVFQAMRAEHLRCLAEQERYRAERLAAASRRGKRAD